MQFDLIAVGRADGHLDKAMKCIDRYVYLLLMYILQPITISWYLILNHLLKFCCRRLPTFEY